VSLNNRDIAAQLFGLNVAGTLHNIPWIILNGYIKVELLQ